MLNPEELKVEGLPRESRFGIAVQAMHGLLSASKKEVGKVDFDAIVDASFLVADKMLNYQAVEERLRKEEEERLAKLNQITKAEDRTKLTERNPG